LTDKHTHTDRQTDTLITILRYNRDIGVIVADFHGAMVATAPGEKLFIGRCPVKNWTQLHWQSMIQVVTPYDIKPVYVHKVTFVLRRINKNCCHHS